MNFSRQCLLLILSYLFFNLGAGAQTVSSEPDIDSLTNYLLSCKCPGLTIRKDFTSGANHGAALAQVMQNAVAFGYCERHQSNND